jgi:hypothetical protein
MVASFIAVAAQPPAPASVTATTGESIPFAYVPLTLPPPLRHACAQAGPARCSPLHGNRRMLCADQLGGAVSSGWLRRSNSIAGNRAECVGAPIRAPRQLRSNVSTLRGTRTACSRCCCAFCCGWHGAQRGWREAAAICAIAIARWRFSHRRAAAPLPA